MNGRRVLAVFLTLSGIAILSGIAFSYYGIFLAGDAVASPVDARQVQVPVYFPTPEYNVIEKPVIVEKIVTETVEKPVEVIRYIDRNTPTPVIPIYFNSVEDCESFIDSNRDKLPIMLIANSLGSVSFNSTESNKEYDCDDYARKWERIAMDAGYMFPQVPVVDGKVWGVRVTSIRVNHVGNWTMVDGVYYYLETSPCPDRWNLVRIGSAD